MSDHARREGPPDIGGMVSLKVDNITFRTTVEDLKDKFSKYGSIGDVYIPRFVFSQWFYFLFVFIKSHHFDGSQTGVGLVPFFSSLKERCSLQNKEVISLLPLRFFLLLLFLLLFRLLFLRLLSHDKYKFLTFDPNET